MRISRPCYDKPHRCPGWIGGGDKLAKVKRCDGGRINVYGSKLWRWKFGKCNTCDVRTIPWAFCQIFPANLKYRIKRAWNEFLYTRRLK
jgi:hypothetical protein